VPIAPGQSSTEQRCRPECKDPHVGYPLSSKGGLGAKSLRVVAWLAFCKDPVSSGHHRSSAKNVETLTIGVAKDMVSG
jgi:hypothetical protein